MEISEALEGKRNGVGWRLDPTLVKAIRFLAINNGLTVSKQLEALLLVALKPYEKDLANLIKPIEKK